MRPKLQDCLSILFIAFLSLQATANSEFVNEACSCFTDASSVLKCCKVSESKSAENVIQFGYEAKSSIVEEKQSDTIILSNYESHDLSKNKVRATYNNANSIFSNMSGAPGYEVPKDSGTHSMFASAIWIGALDANNEAYVAASCAGFDEQQWFAGPLKVNDGTTDTVTSELYNKIWYVDRATVENFKILYENGNISDGSWPVDETIASWPGNGPEGYDQNLAPYIDHNNDGQYNPMDGDYPKMKGDEMVYWIMNDNLAETNTETLGSNMGLEMHCTAWSNVYEDAYNDSIDLVNYVNFLDVVIVNRSNRNYNNVFLGFWTEFNLGNPFDDYVGSDVMNKAFYVFNGDDYDEDWEYNGYGENPPAQAVVFLKAPRINTLPDINRETYLSKFLTFHSINDYSGYPETKWDYYNALQGKWQNHQSITYGGFGVGESGIPCDYMYPGNSDPYNIGTNGLEVPDYPNWSESNQENVPGERNALGSNGPFVLAAGERKSFRFAFVYDRYRYGAQSSLDKLREKLPFVISWQEKNDFPSNYNFDVVPVGIQNATNDEGFVNIYPNPAKDFFNLRCKKRNANYRIYNASGKIISSGSLSEGNNHFSVQSLSKGVYIIRVESEKNVKTQKIIVK